MGRVGLDASPICILIDFGLSNDFFFHGTALSSILYYFIFYIHFIYYTKKKT